LPLVVFVQRRVRRPGDHKRAHAHRQHVVRHYIA
jgi:hypothetical protein